MKGAVAGLILAAIGFGGPPRAAAADWSTAQTVRVATTEYKFTPNSLSFHQGMTYHLRIANKGKETHEFTAPEFFKAIQLRDAKPLNPDRTEIVIQPGRREDLYFVAGAPGSYKLTCSDHDWAGMTGHITITP